MRRTAAVMVALGATLLFTGPEMIAGASAQTGAAVLKSTGKVKSTRKPGVPIASTGRRRATNANTKGAEKHGIIAPHAPSVQRQNIR